MNETVKGLSRQALETMAENACGSDAELNKQIPAMTDAQLEDLIDERLSVEERAPSLDADQD
ncbi:hypothetical protein AWH63_10105 [Marinobacter sp. C18]|uniref:hypothetical protein n=1 Tax=Marinobacter sp. C18 TaxID=1772288 RepID=UPI000948D903|nr:hypothetical protein [Marinobacter sp. C18]OLF81887.1 hypothetical protein AWH63_10105 [Marinobacter sp. C18]